MRTNEEHKRRKFADVFYKTTKWQQCRLAYLVSVGFECQRCRDKGIIQPATQVHHKIRITPENINDHSVTLNFENLEALCDECHKQQHGKRSSMRTDALGHVEL